MVGKEFHAGKKRIDVSTRYPWNHLRLQAGLPGATGLPELESGGNLGHLRMEPPVDVPQENSSRLGNGVATHMLVFQLFQLF